MSDDLPADADALRALLLPERAAHERTRQQRDRFKWVLQEMIRRYFGRSLEKIDSNQLNLAFAPVEADQAIVEAEPPSAPKSPLSGLWHRPKAGLDYSDLFRAAVRLGQPRPVVVEIARRMLFNLYAANHDDHGRNHAFLYDRETRAWRLSPAFDLTYAPGVLSRGLTIAGEVRPNADTLASFLGTVAIAGPELAALSDQVLASLSRWPKFAAEAEVEWERAVEIGATHRQLLERTGESASGAEPIRLEPPTNLWPPLWS